MSYINFCLVSSVLIVVFCIYISRKFAYWKDRGVKHLKPKFPFGNIDRTQPLHEAVQRMYEKLKSTKERFVGLFFYIEPVALALDLDFIKTILVKDFNYFHDRGLYHNARNDPLSAHLFDLKGQKWRDLRNKLSPTFTTGSMKLVFPAVVKICDELNRTIRAELKMSQEVEMQELLARFTTDVIGTCAFGQEVNSLTYPSVPFWQEGKQVLGLKSFWKQVLCTQFSCLARLLLTRTVPRSVTKLFMKTVRETVVHREIKSTKCNDFMDLMIEMKKSEDPSNSLTFEEIATQAFGFYLAGLETSSTVMVITLHELAKNQKQQQKTRESVIEAMKRHNGELTFETVSDMTYLNQCIKESMRKYPPIPSLIRSVTQDYRLADSKKVLIKGTGVIIPVYGIHHDSTIYPNPDVFDPDRFTPENVATRHPYAYLPFGEGPRSCIGQHFALMQARLGLAMLLSNFKFNVSDKSSGSFVFSKGSSMVAPTNGVWLKVTQI